MQFGYYQLLYKRLLLIQCLQFLQFQKLGEIEREFICRTLRISREAAAGTHFAFIADQG